MKDIYRVRASLIFSPLVILLLMGVIGPLTTAHAATGTVALGKTGLDHQDSLTSGTIDTTYWKFNGSAGREVGAKFAFSEDSQGLHIGVQSGAPGTFAGFFAISPDTPATLYHAFVTLSYPSMMTGETFNTGLYVQTFDPNSINYVGCVVQSTSSGYYWVVAQATGIVQGIVALQVTILYQSQTYPPTDTTHLNQDCTIITNGSNYLKVYIGGNVVVNRNDLNLNMASPFNAYLEPQTTSTSSMHFGTYTNYYSTFGEDVTVSNAPPGGTVKIVDTSNNVLASAPVPSTGTAILTVGKYRLPLTANINVYDSANNLVASSSSPVTIWGGNAYTASISWTPGTSSLTVTSQDSSGAALNGYYTVLYQNGAVVATGFTPKTFTLNNGQTYTVQVQDFGSFHFGYWLDTGSSTRDRLVTTGTSLTLTAVYCSTTCSPPTSQSLISVNTVNSVGVPISGMFTTLWQNGVQLASCFSPCGFTVANGQTYQVAVADFGVETFNHWSDGTTNRFHTVNTPTTGATITLTAVYFP